MRRDIREERAKGGEREGRGRAKERVGRIG